MSHETHSALSQMVKTVGWQASTFRALLGQEEGSVIGWTRNVLSAGQQQFHFELLLVEVKHGSWFWMQTWLN